MELETRLALVVAGARRTEKGSRDPGATGLNSVFVGAPTTPPEDLNPPAEKKK